MQGQDAPVGAEGGGHNRDKQPLDPAKAKQLAQIQAELDADDDWYLEPSPIYPHLTQSRPSPGPRRRRKAPIDGDLSVNSELGKSVDQTAPTPAPTLENATVNEPAPSQPVQPAAARPTPLAAEDGHGGPSPDEAMPATIPIAGEPADLKAFLDFLRDQGNMPLASLVSAAFAAYRSKQQLTFVFEHRHGHMIPMLTNPVNAGGLRAMIAQHFGTELEPRFDTRANPEVVAAEAAERKRLNDVQEHPKIKFILQRFGGRIEDCKPLGQSEE